MFKTLLLKYYYVWFQGHKRSKYAHQFSHYWLSGFLQVVATLIFFVFTFLIIVERTLGVRLSAGLSKWELVILFIIIPSLLLYYLLFNYYGVDKNNDDPSAFGIRITKRTKIIAWIVYVGAFVLFLLVLQFFMK